ncbi:hypothetical protein C0993_001861, partial [Termitomyces sp. T159_Od127]
MSSDLKETVIMLPDILAEWPWKRAMNPHSDPEMKSESQEWIQTFVSTPHMQRAFDLGEFDLMKPQEAQQLTAVVLDAIGNPDKTRPSHECVVGEAIRQLWKLVSKCSSVAARARLIKSLENYTTAVAQQAQDRALDYVRDIDEYLPVR